eukprot:6194545-Pleurochrysis_carterae.AAC.2
MEGDLQGNCSGSARATCTPQNLRLRHAPPVRLPIAKALVDSARPRSARAVGLRRSLASILSHNNGPLNAHRLSQADAAEPSHPLPGPHQRDALIYLAALLVAARHLVSCTALSLALHNSVLGRLA